MTKEEELYISIGQNFKNTEQSQMFGKPCFKVGGKAYICFFKNEMVFKLSGKTHREALSVNGSKLFDPSEKKRPMKEWVQVSSDYSESWSEFVKSAMEYVSLK